MSSSIGMNESTTTSTVREEDMYVMTYGTVVQKNDERRTNSNVSSFQRIDFLNNLNSGEKQTEEFASPLTACIHTVELHLFSLEEGQGRDILRNGDILVGAWKGCVLENVATVPGPLSILLFARESLRKSR